MVHPRHLAIFFAALVTSVMAGAQTKAAPDLPTIVHKVERAEAEARAAIPSYQVTREYLFYEGDEKPKADSAVVANMNYYPPDTKQFSIQNSTGSGRGQHIVKKVLEHETQMASQWQQSAITEANYNFSFAGEETLDGRRCFILGLEPRREAKELLKGKAWVDAENFRILRVQGEPAKSPSFWIKKLDVTLFFSNVEGMWLQTAIRAVADVRMFGKNVLSEHDLNYRVETQNASKRAPRRTRPEMNIATYVR